MEHLTAKLPPYILVALGGMLGALARYGLACINRPHFPIGTLAVNLVGCLLMGLLLRGIEVGIARHDLRLFIGIGFLGAVTTFSSFSAETLHLFLQGNAVRSLLYIAATLVGTLAAVTGGYLLARLIWR
jgi:CrcB protein